MTENNAAQPGEKLLDYAVAIAHERELEVTGHKHDSEGAVRRFKAAVDRALLSKVRAEGVQAGDERANDALTLLRKYKALCMEIGRGDSYHLGRIDAAIAALASAPVAGEAVAIPLRPLTEDERAAVEFYTLNPTAAVRDLDKRLSSHAALASTAVAGKAQKPTTVAFVNGEPASCGCTVRFSDGGGEYSNVHYVNLCDTHSGAALLSKVIATGELTRPQHEDLEGEVCAALDLGRLEPASGAPQASEAVRILFPTHLRKMWSGGEVQAWLDEHQGITPPKVSAKGSLERYRKWQAEQTQADKDGVNELQPSSWEADWAKFIDWHKRQFGVFDPTNPEHNRHRISWQAGVRSKERQ